MSSKSLSLRLPRAKLVLFAVASVAASAMVLRTVAKFIPSAKNMLSIVASFAASTMVVRTVVNDFIPKDLTYYFTSRIRRFLHRFSSSYTITVEEFQGYSRNKLFGAVETYLASKVANSTVRSVKLHNAENEKDLLTTMDEDEELVDYYENMKLKWTMYSRTVTRGHYSHDHGGKNVKLQVRYYELAFDKKHKDKVLTSYLPCILDEAKEIQLKNRSIKLHTVEYGYWHASEINLDHPMTFDTLAMDAELKKEVLEDLDNFVTSKEYYRKIGRAWKRGYLLYGPPGTGKSSLIAAMANHLNYDIYNLDLTAVDDNSELMTLLLGMSSRSILVVEDIDCNIKLENRESKNKSDGKDKKDDKDDKVTLSGLLNFVDGLCSCCGEQRIIIFTTNHKEKLDPALVRPGHRRLLGEAEVTPAEVAGQLIKTKHANASLQGLLKFLQNKKAEKDKMKAGKDSNKHVDASRQRHGTEKRMKENEGIPKSQVQQKKGAKA